MSSAELQFRSASPEDPAAYVPLDRRLALASSVDLPERATGSALFADISGFTALTARLTQALGLRRGAEELPGHLDRVYQTLISQVHGYGGSVISFSGDAITCWLEGDDGRGAAACAWAMQAAMQEFTEIALPDGSTATLTLKVAVATGPVRRLVVGSPDVQLMDVIGGETLNRLAEAESLAGPGEVEVDQKTAGQLPDVSWRGGFAVLKAAVPDVHPTPPVFPAVQDLSRWLLPEVSMRLMAGQGEFLTELRPVTALFIGFGGIDYDYDPDAGRKLDAFVQRVQHEAARLEGSLLQLTVGDKGSYLYLAFGAPVSHEDDPRRAVTVARRLQALTDEFSFLTGLRMGLSSGTMRTGAYGGVMRRTYGALGNETNMAARLMGVAEDGQILATEAVLRDSGFSWRALNPVVVKGRTAPLAVYEPVAEQRTATAHHPLIGRQAELEQLRSRLELAAAGFGQQVLVTGDAGIGKSRLVAELLSGAEGFRVITGEAEAFLADTPYHPWHQVFSAILGSDPQLALPPDLLQRLPLLAPVLNLVLPDNAMTASLDPELRKAAREALLLELIRREATRQPLLLVLEDAQWLDPLSRELLTGLSRLAPGLPLLILVTSRDAVEQAIQLQALSGPESLELLEERLGTGELTANLAERLLEQAEGNPYYLEQLAAYVADGQHEPELPDSLHSLVLSRVDRLSEHQKATLKAASIIGRRFDLGVLQGYYPALGDAGRVSTEAAELQRLELLGHEPPYWAFRQLVTRDVSYASIPFAVRSQLHGRLARYIETHIATDSEPLLDLLALHYSFSEDAAKQREYLLRAGIAAQESYANETALNWFGQLLPLVEEGVRPALLLRMAQVETHLGRYAAAAENCQLALDSTDVELEAARSLRLLGELSEKQGDYAAATNWLEQARSRLELLDEPAELIQVLLAEGGNVMWQIGEYDTAGERLQAALRLARNIADDRSVARAQHGLGNLELYQGNLSAARDLFSDSLTTRRRIGDSLGVANALNNLGIIAASLEGTAAARTLFEESLEIRREIGDRAGTAVALNNVGFMAAAGGELTAAGRLYQESLQLRREIGDRLGTAVTLNSLGHLYLKQELNSDSAACYQESLQELSEIGNQRELAAAIAGAAALAGATEPTLAVTLAGLATGLLDSIGSAAEPEVQALLDDALEQGRQQLGAVRTDSALKRGQLLDLHTAVGQAIELLARLSMTAD